MVFGTAYYTVAMVFDTTNYSANLIKIVELAPLFEQLSKEQTKDKRK